VTNKRPQFRSCHVGEGDALVHPIHRKAQLARSGIEVHGHDGPMCYRILGIRVINEMRVLRRQNAASQKVEEPRVRRCHHCGCEVSEVHHTQGSVTPIRIGCADADSDTRGASSQEHHVGIAGAGLRDTIADDGKVGATTGDVEALTDSAKLQPGQCRVPLYWSSRIARSSWTQPGK